MKKTWLLILTIIFLATSGYAQDIITLTNGKQIQAKVMEINPGDIKYKDYNNQDGPTISVLKVSVSSIQYANGVRTVFNDGNEPQPSSGHYVRGEHNGGRNHGGYRKEPEKNEGLHGWYFGLQGSFGVGSVSSNDPNYSVSSGGYSQGDILATKMFNEHLGIQFGLGEEAYNYSVTFPNSPGSYYAYSSDNFEVVGLTIPVRAVYFSNTKERVGFYGMVGFDMTFVTGGSDREGDDITPYYSSFLFSPYVSCGVEFRSRNARSAWMIGPYFKTTLNNAYSGNNADFGWLNTGTTGSFTSAGLSISYMGKFWGMR